MPADAQQPVLRLAGAEAARGNFATALALLEQLPAAVRNSSQVRLERAALHGQLGQRDQEIALYEELIRQNPSEPRLFTSLGNALNYSGRAQEAVDAFRHAIKLNPSFGEPWWGLANLKSFAFEQRDIRAMQQALERSTSEADAVHLHFALGSALEQSRNFAQAFRHYDLGNKLRAAKLKPEQVRVTSFVSAAIATLDRRFLERHAGAGSDALGPIFIVGLQRSGSTLIEQILASHPEIEATSELAVMQQLWTEIEQLAAANGRNAFEQLALLDRERIRRIGEDYLERSAPFRRLGKPWFIDKLPGNWLNSGLIRLALPNARIIDARRHPMACGFSNFKQLYALGVTYAYSQRSIGYFYRDYLRLMDHFDAVSPGAICHVTNEALVADPQAEVRRMLDYIGLPFDPACLDFHQRTRAVHTPSAEQVRRPLSRDGFDAWRPFEQWLEPLKVALGPALDGWMPRQAPVRSSSSVRPRADCE